MTRLFVQTICVFAGAMISAGCAMPPAEFRLPRDGGSPWREITTEHFTFETDLGDSSIEALADQIENARNVMIRMAFEREPPPGPRIRIIALPYTDFRHFWGGDAVGLFMHGAWFEPILITGTSNERGSPALDLITHELGHAIASQFIPAETQPRWFAEGLASYLETARFAASGTAYIGMPRGRQVGPLSDLLSLDELWGWKDLRSDPHGPMLDRLYESSWAVIHYLIDVRRHDFDAYARALTAGEDPQQAWRQIFPDLVGTGFDKTMSAYFREYQYSATFGVKKRNLDHVRVRLSARTLGDADVLGIRAMLYMTLAGGSNRSPDDDERRARQFVAEALHDNASSLWPQLVNARYFDTMPDRAELAQRALQEHRDDWLAWLWYENVLHAQGAPIAERRSALEHAGTLAPNTEAIQRASEQLEHDDAAACAAPTSDGALAGCVRR